MKTKLRKGASEKSGFYAYHATRPVVGIAQKPCFLWVLLFFLFFFSRQPPPRATVHFETTRSSSVGILLQIPGVGCFFVITTLYTDTAYRAPTKEVRLGFTRTPGVPAQVQYHVYCILMSYFFLGNTAFFRVRPQAGPASLFLTLSLLMSVVYCVGRCVARSRLWKEMEI